MRTEDTKPPPFYCPACGKKHRADLSAITGQDGAHAKVACHRCEIEMTVSMGSDGLPKCEIRDGGGDAAHTSVSAPTAAPGGAMSMSSLPLHLVAAALVAGVVSFLVVTLAGGSKDDADGRAERISTLEKGLAATTTNVDALEKQLAQRSDSPEPGGVEEIQAQVKALQGELARIEKSVSGNAAGVEDLGKIFRNFSASFEKLEADYKALNGRIEANYQRARGVAKRLEALEAK